MILLIPFAGFVVGFLIGVTGMGGGALMTPFLIGVLKFNPAIAVGTDLIFAAFTKLFGGYRHLKHGHLKINEVGWLALGSLPASWFGSRIMLINQSNTVWTEEIFPTLLGLILIVVGFITFFSKRKLKVKTNLEKHPSGWVLIIFGVIGGFLVGLTSIGGGTIIMALLILFYSLPTNNLVGLDITHGAILASFSATFYLIHQQVDWPTVILLICGSLPGVFLGALFVKKAVNFPLKKILGLILFFLGWFYILYFKKMRYKSWRRM